MSRTGLPRRLILIGGGHAHLSVLHALASNPLDIEVVLVTPGTSQIYSGMAPGWVAGQYSLQDCQIDLLPLAQAASAKLVTHHATGVDANRRRVYLSDGTHMDYDFLSLDVGSVSNLMPLGALKERLLALKPIGGFVERWPEILAMGKARHDFHLAVIGGGAAGVEIAFAAQHVFSTHAPGATVTLIASEKGIMHGHAAGVAKRVRNLLRLRGIVLHETYAVGDEQGVVLGNGQHLPADRVIAATGSSSPAWLQSSHLALNEHGYISVDATHRSLSHHNVFAAGDVCARSDTDMARSGVHAVFAGPVLAHNLLASIRGGDFIRYTPRKRSLYLLATGPRYAIASWGAFSAEGAWVWYWKNWIDRRFMNKHKSKGNGGKNAELPQCHATDV